MKKSDVKMEDIRNWLVSMYDRMDKDNLELSKEDEDNMDKELTSVLEKFFNYPDYQRYN